MNDVASTSVKKLTKNKTKLIVISAVCVAFGFIIPMFVPTIEIVPGYVSVTIGSHAPVMLGMMISPFVAVATALITTLAFVVKGAAAPVILRALSHVIFALIGSLLAKKMMKKMSTTIALNGITAVIHALSEILAVYIAFFLFTDLAINISAFYVYVIVGLVTLCHSIVDFTIAYAIFVPLTKAKLLNLY